MLILTVDTSSRAGGVALSRDGELLAEVTGREDTPYSTRLFRDIQSLQARADFRIADVDVFACATGPGSFTGLRVGLSAIKSWAEVHSKPVAAIGVLEAIASQANAGASECVVPFLDGRRGNVFWAVYAAGREPSGQRDLMQITLASAQSVSPVDEFLVALQGVLGSRQAILISPTPEVIPAPETHRLLPNVIVERALEFLAPCIAKLAYEHALRGELTNALDLDANYVRASDAEVPTKRT